MLEADARHVLEEAIPPRIPHQGFILSPPVAAAKINHDSAQRPDSHVQGVVRCCSLCGGDALLSPTVVTRTKPNRDWAFVAQAMGIEEYKLGVRVCSGRGARRSHDAVYERDRLGKKYLHALRLEQMK